MEVVVHLFDRLPVRRQDDVDVVTVTFVVRHEVVEGVEVPVLNGDTAGRI